MTSAVCLYDFQSITLSSCQKQKNHDHPLTGSHDLVINFLFFGDEVCHFLGIDDANLVANLVNQAFFTQGFDHAGNCHRMHTKIAGDFLVSKDSVEQQLARRFLLSLVHQKAAELHKGRFVFAAMKMLHQIHQVFSEGIDHQRCDRWKTEQFLKTAV